MAYRPFDLTGKVGLVTGGNGGIGLGFADAMAQAGADIAIWGTNEGKNEKAVAQLKGHGVKARAWKVDVADEAAVVKAMKETAEAMGRIDSVFANAGIGKGETSVMDITAESWRKVLSVNLDGFFWTCREASRHMVDRWKAGDRAGGRIVGVSSLGAIHGQPRTEHYAASKGAVITIIQSLAVELARYRVTANSVLPGWIATEMTQHAQGNEKFTERVIGRVPMRRWGTPEDFGGIAVYLASDASGYHSADTFLIDGAYSRF
ncbi:MAG: SDR family oxidoreductase [Alphaproteobacteria bacterium]|nr:SDR family oxidoreductase [Alphaproteobacteria bacterium]